MFLKSKSTNKMGKTHVLSVKTEKNKVVILNTVISLNIESQTEHLNEVILFLKIPSLTQILMWVSN